MAGSGLFRLYMGSLQGEVAEADIQELFQEHQLTPPLSVVIKPAGYAFIECPDQNTFDSAIDKLNGIDFKGSSIQVEASAVSKRRRTNRIQILNMPSKATKEDIDKLISTFGKVQRQDIVTLQQEVSVYVTYEKQDQAQQAVEQLQDYDYQGATLKTDYVSSSNSDNGKTRANGKNAASGQASGYPVRLLVPGDFVGAIIGKKGATIRRITTDSKARIDVHREGSVALLEKVVSVYGHPEQCSAACGQILAVMQREADNTNSQEVALKLLAPDHYCGRIIGKEGKIIKKLREETDSKISVSNVQELPGLYPDRVITIRGSQDNISAAEAVISARLRECHDRDPLHTHMPHAGLLLPGAVGGRGSYGAHIQGSYPALYPTRHNGTMSASGSGGYYPPPRASLLYGGGRPPGGGPPEGGGATAAIAPPTHQVPSIREEIVILVPNSAVGAVIGTGGNHIKQIIRETGAYVTIESGDGEVMTTDRKVTLKGSHQAKCKASYMVFEKLQKEGFAGSDEMRLKTAVYVPREMVGKVIGKKGVNVREMQRLTGAMVSVSSPGPGSPGGEDDPRSPGPRSPGPRDDPRSPNPRSAPAQSDDDSHVMVQIYGTFMQTNMAQSRLRSLLSTIPQGTSQSQTSHASAHLHRPR